MATPRSSRRKSTGPELASTRVNGKNGHTASERPASLPSLAEIQAQLQRAQTQLRAEHDQLRAAQLALQLAKEQLEIRVQERTAELRHANEELSAEVARRSRLERELLEISEREKRTFGQDLHDETCQSLAGLSLMARVLARDLHDACPPLGEKADRLSDQLRLLVEQTRSIARGLHPVTLTGGLVPALQELGDRVQDRVPCRFRGVEEPRLSDAEKLSLYRIAQEAVHNAVRHSRASQIEITLRRSGTVLELCVEDDGVGLSREVKSGGHKGMGMDIMGYRARSIGAVLMVEHKPRGGVRVICSLPCVEH